MDFHCRFTPNNKWQDLSSKKPQDCYLLSGRTAEPLFPILNSYPPKLKFSHFTSTPQATSCALWFQVSHRL